MKIILALLLFTYQSQALNPEDINQVVDACMVQVPRDTICDFLFQVRGVSDDAVEAVKVFFKLTPRDYAILTVANMIATNRIRFQTKSYLHPDARHTFDFKKDNFVISVEMKF